jgi:hypothetical protein
MRGNDESDESKSKKVYEKLRKYLTKHMKFARLLASTMRKEQFKGEMSYDYINRD